MGEKINYLPKGFIPDGVGEESDRIMEEMYKYEPLRQSRVQLESTMLNEKYRYYKQMGIVKECLKNVFGDKDHMIIITNRFLSILEDFMDAYKALKEGEKDVKRKGELEDKYNYEEAGMRSYLHDYGQEYFDKLEEENPDLGFQELSNLRVKIKNAFVRSLQERLTYVPKIEK